MLAHVFSHLRPSTSGFCFGFPRAYTEAVASGPDRLPRELFQTGKRGARDRPSRLTLGKRALVVESSTLSVVVARLARFAASQSSPLIAFAPDLPLLTGLPNHD